MDDRGTLVIPLGNSGVSPELLTWVVRFAQDHGASNHQAVWQGSVRSLSDLKFEFTGGGVTLPTRTVR